jgi:hypothetical protein
MEFLLDNVLRHTVAVLAAVLLGIADPQPSALTNLLEQIVDQAASVATGAHTEALAQRVHLGANRIVHVLGDEGAHLASQRLLFG